MLRACSRGARVCAVPSLCCGCPVAFCAALRLVASIALLASSSGAAIAARCPSAAPALPSAAPARGVVAPLAAERSRPTAPRDGSNCLACPGVGASTGALPLAGVDAVAGDLQGPRAGAHGCATFFSLVSLSSKPSLSRSLLVVLASRELGADASYFDQFLPAAHQFAEFKGSRTSFAAGTAHSGGHCSSLTPSQRCRLQP